MINSGYGNYGANLTKKYERMDVQRRQRQGGHRGQHRHSAAAEPRRLHGHPNGNGGTENHADKRCSRRIDARRSSTATIWDWTRRRRRSCKRRSCGSSPLWADTPVCDAERMDNFYQLQQLAFLSYLMNGDTIALLPMKHQAGVPYDLRVRLIEADRVCSPDGFDRLMPCTVQGYEVQSIVQGVETDADGMVTASLDMQPASAGSNSAVDAAGLTWQRVEAYGDTTGRRNVLHIMSRERIGQRRGVPCWPCAGEPETAWPLYGRGDHGGGDQRHVHGVREVTKPVGRQTVWRNDTGGGADRQRRPESSIELGPGPSLT